MDLQINKEQLPPPKNINISYPKNHQNLIVTWNEVRKPKEVDTIKYNIYRGSSPNGIFYKLNNKPLNQNRFEDKEISLNRNVTNWYKVSAIACGNNDKVEGKLSSAEMYKVNNTNKWFKKINERNLWILKNTGQLFDLYTRKNSGKKCSKCYDGVRGQSGNRDCPSCFGTGYEGGYEPQFQLYVRQKPAQKSMEITDEGFVHNHTPGAWTISTKQIKNRDLLISPQGIIFSVTSSHVNHAAGVLFHQELQMKELDQTDSRYNIQREDLYPNL
jgi:hypothetical protein